MGLIPGLLCARRRVAAQLTFATSECLSWASLQSQHHAIRSIESKSDAAQDQADAGTRKQRRGGGEALNIFDG